MNKALLERFLSLLDVNYHIKFTRKFTKNPAVTFLEVFKYYTEQYGSTGKDDWIKNKQRELADLHPSQGFHNLVNQLMEQILFSTIIGAQVKDKRVVDIGLVCIKKCGLFSTAYGEWIVKDDQSFEQFMTFWKSKCDLLCKTSQAAGQYGYGGNVTQNKDEQSFEDSVDKFAEAHNATQSSIVQLTQQNAQLQATILQMQQQLAYMMQQLQ